MRNLHLRIWILSYNLLYFIQTYTQKSLILYQLETVPVPILDKNTKAIPLPLIKDRTTYEQPLPLNLSIPDFDSSLRHAPTNLRIFMYDNANNIEIFDLKQRHVCTVESLNNSNKNFFFH